MTTETGTPTAIPSETKTTGTFAEHLRELVEEKKLEWEADAEKTVQRFRDRCEEAAKNGNDWTTVYIQKEDEPKTDFIGGKIRSACDKDGLRILRISYGYRSQAGMEAQQEFMIVKVTWQITKPQ